RGEAALVGGPVEAEVPGADLLAVVAAEEPGPRLGLELVRHRAAVLDRQVGDAASRVDHVGTGKGVGGAGAKAAAARSTEVLVGRVVGGDLAVHDEAGQKHPAPVGAGDEAAVLADPTQ